MHLDTGFTGSMPVPCSLAGPCHSCKQSEGKPWVSTRVWLSSRHLALITKGMTCLNAAHGSGQAASSGRCDPNYCM